MHELPPSLHSSFLAAGTNARLDVIFHTQITSANLMVPSHATALPSLFFVPFLPSALPFYFPYCCISLLRCMRRSFNVPFHPSFLTSLLSSFIPFLPRSCFTAPFLLHPHCHSTFLFTLILSFYVFPPFSSLLPFFIPVFLPGLSVISL